MINTILLLLFLTTERSSMFQVKPLITTGAAASTGPNISNKGFKVGGSDLSGAAINKGWF
jgi:hypothetical protein